MMNDAIILIPSYEPLDVLISLSKGLKEQGFDILIVNDGSGEKFNRIFEECGKYSTVLSYSLNKGKGEALKYGYRYILKNFKTYKYVITCDGDGQHCIKDVKKIYSLIKNKNITIIGERNLKGKTPIKSKLGNGLSKFTQTISTYRYLPDNQCGLRAFLISDLDKMIKIKGSRYEYEMNVLSYIELKEIPFQMLLIDTIYENNNANSHFRPFQDTARIQCSIILHGLLSLFTFCLQAFLTLIFSNYIFVNNVISIELSILISFAICLFVHILLKFLFYKPNQKLKMFFRIFIYQIFSLLIILLFGSIFVRILNINILLCYLICFGIMIIPFYYLIKGFGIVYDSQINGD